MRSIVYYYTHIEQPFTASAALLGRDPGRWLPAPARAMADAVTPEWVVTLHAEGAMPQPLADHPALVRLGPASQTSTTLLRSIAWRSASAQLLTPVLEADLSLTSLDGYGCQLSLMGSYRPPLAVAGAAGDRLLGHRVAEACVRRFVLELADRLGQALQRV